MQHWPTSMSPSTKWKLLQRYAHIPMNFTSALIKACHNMPAFYKKRVYIINTPEWKITNCSRHYTPSPRAVTHGGVQMRISHLLLWAATPRLPHIAAWGACGAEPSTIYLIATRTWKDQYNTSKRFLKPFGSGSITCRFYNTLLLLWVTHGNKGFKSQRASCGATSLVKDIYKHLIFSAAHPFSKRCGEALTDTEWQRMIQRFLNCNT